MALSYSARPMLCDPVLVVVAVLAALFSHRRPGPDRCVTHRRFGRRWIPAKIRRNLDGTWPAVAHAVLPRPVFDRDLVGIRLQFDRKRRAPLSTAIGSNFDWIAIGDRPKKDRRPRSISGHDSVRIRSDRRRQWHTVGVAFSRQITLNSDY